MPSSRDWWPRVSASVKHKRNLYFFGMRTVRLLHHHHHLRAGGRCLVVSQEIDSAVIRATSHNERSMDYKSAGRVFEWARSAPSAFLNPLMWSVARRAARTRSWVVALKSLLLAHGLILCSDEAPPLDRLGRLPFDLSDFSDRSSSSGSGFTAFVRAYFRFLDRHSYFAALGSLNAPFTATSGDIDDDLQRIERLQVLLDLLMQIQPYANGMEVKLVLEAMNCVAMEIFDVYSAICTGIAQFLTSILGPGGSSRLAAGREGEGAKEARLRRRGTIGVRILQRSSDQSEKLSAYLDLCRRLGVLNSTEFPPVERVPDKDIEDLEHLLLAGGGASGLKEEEEEETMETPEKLAVEDTPAEETEKKRTKNTTVITGEWVVFEDDEYYRKKIQGQNWNNPFQSSPGKKPPTESVVNSGLSPLSNGNLIDLI